MVPVVVKEVPVRLKVPLINKSGVEIPSATIKVVLALCINVLDAATTHCALEPATLNVNEQDCPVLSII